MFTLYGLSLVSALVLSLALSLPEHRKQPWMVLELPVYRRPSLPVVFNKVRQEVKNYTRKALTVVMLAMTVLWGQRTYFPTGEIATSYAAQFGKAASAIYEPLGFGTQWPLVASLPGSIAAKENSRRFSGFGVKRNNGNAAAFCRGIPEPDFRSGRSGEKQCRAPSGFQPGRAGCRFDQRTGRALSRSVRQAAGLLLPCLLSVFDSLHHDAQRPAGRNMERS